MGKGFIKVQLFSAKNVMPVCGGNIFIIESTATDFENGKILTTDECGVSKVVAVNTPDRAVGENPAAKDVPYSSYDIYIRAKGYRDIAIEGIHVFPDIISIQNVEMIPTKKERVFMDEAEFIFIPPHKLLELSQRNRIEGLKIGLSGSAALKIPQYVTVHLGAPNSYAENVTLDFLDYIKNVASSEIYPTWPDEAIRANVYAEISLVLNRIETEWYKNKGYAFDITNCGTYDQEFVRGRNIYNNIARVVDDVFNEYIESKEGTGPILAASCSGISESCNGLSKWGTVVMANNGCDALEILKKYFGDDISLEKVSDICGLEEQYAGDELKLGSKGKVVETLQRKLNKISENFTAINKIDCIEGEFNNDTYKAVKAFQEIFNIASTGIINRITWYKISVIYNNIKKLSEFIEEGEEHNIGVSPEYLLRYGDSGAAVREFQRYLRVVGQYYSVIPQIEVNGEFDLNTKAAVLAFQKKFDDIDVDGIVGKKTWDKIYEVYCDLK